tara:strand:- start:448 stop:1821 length:1374 start_codon:yes stop_codon:yes gene_type:complete
MSRLSLFTPLGLLLALPAAAQDLQPLLGDPVPGLSPANLALFEAGKTTFLTNLLESEGAGPIFNETSCAACHNFPTTGGFGTRAVTRFGIAAIGGNPFDPMAAEGGTLRQDQSFDPACAEIVPLTATVTAMRQTPICFGAGLLEAVLETDILAGEAAQGGLGLTGFARSFAPIEGGAARSSRFGWKGGPSTVMSFSIDASLNEMGLTSTFLPNENAPNGDAVLLAACDSVADPEDAPDLGGFTRIERMTHFQAMLAAPPQTPKNGMTGATLFDTIGCADCHTPGYTTGVHSIPALSGVAIQPYTDFLIHDMGGLGDGIVDGPVSETEHLTRALWGLRHRSDLLHDGRANGGTPAQNVHDAILFHGGEGQASNDAYVALSGSDQALVQSFLLSLGQVEFDFENDNDVDRFDWFFINPSFTGPVSSYTPDDAEAISDIDQDGHIDLREFGLLQRAWTGE